MAKKYVYVETSVVSYLTAAPSRDLVCAARQELTVEWWERKRSQFKLFTSQLVVTEAKAGDRKAAAKRLQVLKDMKKVKITPEAGDVAAELIEKGPLPAKAIDDATHLALAAISKMDYLLTWNCRHLANAEFTKDITNTLTEAGLKVPVICTPEALLGE